MMASVLAPELSAAWQCAGSFGLRLRTAFAKSSRQDRLISIEGLRGYAALLVFLVHHHSLFGSYLNGSRVAFNISLFLHVIGNSGVDVFFVLSGFLIYGHVMRKPSPCITFLRRRIRRIYPTFLVVLGTYIVLSPFVQHGSKLPKPLTAELGYIAENVLLLPGIFDIDPLVTVTWSLSYELFFYISIPLLVVFTRIRQWRRLPRVTFFLAVFVVHCAGYRFGVLPHIRLAMFTAGILLFEIVDGQWIRPKLSAFGEWLSILGYLGALGFLGWTNLVRNSLSDNRGVPLMWTLLLSISVSALVLYCIGFSGVLNAFFSTGIVRCLGNMSYSYFLVQGLVLNGMAVLMSKLLGSTTSLPIPLFLLLFLLNLTLSIAAGLVLFVAVEWPFSLGGWWKAPSEQGAGNSWARRTAMPLVSTGENSEI